MVDEFSFRTADAGILNILFRHSWVRNSASLFLILGLFLIGWDSVSHRWLITWSLIGVLIFALRQVCYYLYLRFIKDSDTSTLLWRRVYGVTLILNGLFWLVPPLMFMDLAHPGVYTLSIIVMSGVISAGYLSSSLLPRSSFFFLVLLVSGIGYRVLTDFPEFRVLSIFILGFYAYFISQVAHHFRNALLKNIALYQEKTQLVEALNLAREKAEKASLEKSRFLSMTSHEIRTSVNGIVGIIQVMEDSIHKDLNRDYLSTMKKSSSDLLNHLNHLLDLNKIEEGKFSLESRPFDWRETIEDAIKLFHGAATRKKIGLVSEIADSEVSFLIGDATRLGQILKNLISNAIKFTATGDIVVRASLEKTEDTRAHLNIEVEDSGIGIEPTRLKDLFQTFVQEDDSVQRLYGGSGLGLAICQRIAHLMETEIQVSSVKGMGSTFSLSPKFGISDFHGKTSHNTSGDTASAFPRYKCLVVQDDAMSQKVATLLLQKLGMRVDVVDSGERAVEQVRSKYYDYVFMDIKMGSMNGIEATRLIRSSELAHPQPVIIALTGSVMESERAAYEKVGMNGCLAKPLMLDDLRSLFSSTTADTKPVS